MPSIWTVTSSTTRPPGEAIVDGAFQESVLRSTPYFALRIDGITELNNN